MGTLIVKGTLRLSQLWPEGKSDADTVSLSLILEGKNPFTFVGVAGKRAPTRAFHNAESVGKFGPAPVVKRPKNGPPKISVRLQGIDAPELHFQPDIGKKSGGKNKQFRQAMGETCSHALYHFLKSFNRADLPCEFVTEVSKPADVCDVYGRMVGNVVLTLGGTRIDLNQWLLREGWALPGLYNSMGKDEIRAVLTDHAAAVKARRGLYSKKLVSTALAKFDPGRIYRKGATTFKPFSDAGTVNFPKFFRRQADLHVRRAVGENLPNHLKAYLATKKDDIAMPTAKFLALPGPATGAKAKKLFTPIASRVGANRYPTGPELVYFENDTTLYKAGTKTRITKW